MSIRYTQADHRNQQIIGFCTDNTYKNQIPYCHFCSPLHGQHLNKLTSQELLSKWLKERIHNVQNVQKNVQDCKIVLDNLVNVFLPQNNFNVLQLEELGLSQIDQFIKGFFNQKIVKRIYLNNQQSIEQIKLIVNEILKKIKNQKHIKKNDKVQITHNILINNFQNRQSIFSNQNQIQTHLHDKFNQVKGMVRCYCFQQNNSFVVAGCKRDITVFQHIQGKLNQIQLLSEHPSDVYTLNFRKNTNNFVSGSSDSSIIIWQVIGNNC